MAIMSAFQAEDESSIPSTRTNQIPPHKGDFYYYFFKKSFALTRIRLIHRNKKPHQQVRFFIWYARRDSNSRPTGSKPATLIH